MKKFYQQAPHLQTFDLYEKKIESVNELYLFFPKCSSNYIRQTLEANKYTRLCLNSQCGNEKLFDKEVPRTKNDVIIFFVKVIGLVGDVLQEKTYLRKIYGNEKFSAIQLTTASGACSVLKMFLDGKLESKGFTKQESLSWKDFLNNKFGEVYS